ncbi:lipoprotein [Streptomyces sp. NPDC088915]|uniref:lipoprotein n=1 Tax=Streptomyces sp. NPDC088915 TaxID=3365912 RepID=UPI0037F188AA
MRLPIRLLLPALLAAGPLLTGCAGPEPLPEVTPGPRPTAAKPTTARPSDAGAPGAAVAAASLGGPGTACALPVSFSLAQAWEPKAVRNPEDPEFAALTRQGPATVRCEVDAKPAGHLGFLRVWTVEKSAAHSSARAALEAFVKAEKGSSGASYRETTAGGAPAVEVTYTVRSELLDEEKEERALAVATPKGAVVVHLGGTDTEEHRAMVPAYELARTTLKVL